MAEERYEWRFGDQAEGGLSFRGEMLGAEGKRGMDGAQRRLESIGSDDR